MRSRTWRLRLAPASRPFRPGPVASGLIAAVILSVTGLPAYPPAPARAGGGDSPGMCWRGQPWPHCRDFWITETGAGIRLSRSGNPERQANAYRGYLILELGHMFNLKNRSAVGASLSFQGSNESRLTFHPRYRYWLDRRWALDAAGGVVVSSGEAWNYRFRLPGYMTRVGINYGDWIGVNTGVDFMPIRGDRTDVNWFAESRLCGYLGGSAGALLVTSGALLVAALILALSSD